MSRRRNGVDVLDDVVDSAIDQVAVRARQFIQGLGTEQKEKAKKGRKSDGLRKAACSACQEPAPWVCIGCRQPVCDDHLEFAGSDPWVICPACFGFMWDAGLQKVRFLARKAAQQGVAAAPGFGGSEPPKPPWEVLAVSQDASEEEIKKAYRKIIAQWHPDRLSPEQKLDGQRMVDEATKAKNAMMKARSAATL